MRLIFCVAKVEEKRIMKKTYLIVAMGAAISAAVRADVETIELPVTTVQLVAAYPERVAPGRVVPVARVDVMPQVSGEILEVAFQNGSTVSTNDLLYRIDSVKYEAEVKNAEAKKAECEAALKYAELSFVRHEKLASTRAVSQDATDNARSSRDSARAMLEAAKAEVVRAKDDLRHCRIVAPINAKVGTTQFTEGNYVQVGQGPLVTLVQYRPIRVRFSLSNRDFLEMFGGSTRRCCEEGDLSLFLASGEELAEKGRIEYSENVVDELTDTMQFYALYENADYKLRPGSTVMLTLKSKEGVKRPAIPPTAILQDTQGPYVWVLDAEGIAQRRTVARGEVIGDWLFIEKGLKVGERIVADGAHRVRSGMKVKEFAAREGQGAAR